MKSEFILTQVTKRGEPKYFSEFPTKVNVIIKTKKLRIVTSTCVPLRSIVKFLLAV